MKLKHIGALTAFAALCGFLSHGRAAPDRWALIIGISDYVNFQDEIGGDLPGASLDAQRMRDVLISRWGFDASHVRLVLDTDATRERIRHELTDWLPSVVQPNDLVVFYFAGHGSQMWDTSGDEPDGLDETICPTDVLKGNTDGDIADDELNSWLSALPTSDVVAILDNCHAGTGTRAATPFARPRSLARNVESDVAKPADAKSGTAAAEANSDAADNRIEIAAAQADEVAVDAEWPAPPGGSAMYGGAFTTNLVRQLWTVPRRTSYGRIFELTVEDMKRDKFAQRPLLTGAGAAPAFRADAEDAAGAVPVVRATATEVTLAGGSAAGITIGSVYRVGTALVRVQGFRGEEAVATPIGSETPSGQRAQLVAYAVATTPLRVSVADLAADTRSALRSAIASNADLELVEGVRDFAHLIVRPSEAGYRIIGLDGATRHDIARADGTSGIADAVAQELAAHRLARLENPAPPFQLDFDFGAGTAEFGIGDPVSFQVRSAKAGYLTIVDLGTDGNVTVLYPNEYERENYVEAGAVITVPQDAEFEAQEPIGRGIVRVFITEQPLELPFTQGTSVEAAAIEAALRAVVGGSPDGGNALPVSSWATASIVYTIGR